MRIAVLGAGGGLGRNVVDAARAAKHGVVALVRDPKRAELPDDVTTVVGDATRFDDVMRAMTGADATMFCVNPLFATWLTTFRPLLECAIAAARQKSVRNSGRPALRCNPSFSQEDGYTGQSRA